jgi:hypothetical protein
VSYKLHQAKGRVSRVLQIWGIKANLSTRTPDFLSDDRRVIVFVREPLPDEILVALRLECPHLRIYALSRERAA